MSYSLAAAVELRLTVNETLDADDVPAVTTPVLRHDAFNSSFSLNSASTPPITKMSAFELALSGGNATVDLTALTDSLGAATVDGTGLKVQCLKIQNPAANTGAITIVEGASNGHEVLGAAFKIILQPGEEIQFQGIDHASAVEISATHCTWDVTGTGTETSNWLIVLG